MIFYLSIIPDPCGWHTNTSVKISTELSNRIKERPDSFWCALFISKRTDAWRHATGHPHLRTRIKAEGFIRMPRI